MFKMYVNGQLTEFDGVYCLVDGLTENFSLLEGLSAQRTQSNKMWYDIIGTEVTHTITFRRGSCTLANWETLWSLLRSPVASQTFEFPDGENGSITYEGHITGGSRSLDYVDANGKYQWGDYSVTITPITPQIRG